ncbi:MAG: hypothetical protein WC854_12060 [Bacteroidales bacterium]
MPEDIAGSIVIDLSTLLLFSEIPHSDALFFKAINPISVTLSGDSSFRAIARNLSLSLLNNLISVIALRFIPSDSEES